VLLRIDADVHQGVDPAFWQRVAQPWRSMRPGSAVAWPASALGHTGYRSDVHTVDGQFHDRTAQDVIDRLVEPYGVDFAILTGNAGLLGVAAHPNPHFGINFAQAYNDWLIEEWLSHDSRLKGSMMVSQRDVGAAVREVERVGPHPDIVQVLLPANSDKLYGDRAFWPLYEAATALGLPVAIHPSGFTLNPPTSMGWPTTYLEAHTMIATGYLDHMISLACQGAFEEVPGFRFVFVEGGVSTFAPMLWRLEKNWKAVRAEVPWMTASPREYLEDNFRFTTQPIDEPEDPELLRRIFADLRADRSVLFASDWPHWDFDDPEAALRPLSKELRARILGENAATLYGLVKP
jgi:predicted TIM-barrel fold metal-dependent hydrolase